MVSTVSDAPTCAPLPSAVMHWEPVAAATLVEAEATSLFDIAEANPAAAVPACPGWTATDLAVHTASVFGRVAHLCAERATEPLAAPIGSPADPDDPWDWCRGVLATLVDALRGIEPDEPVWSWTDNHSGAFYHRRMVHESIVHRIDAQAAAGIAGRIDDPAIAADGIGDVMSVGMRFRSSGAPIDYPAGTISLLATDTGDRWSLAAVDGALGIGTGEAVITGTDATVTGPAAAIMLYLWGRGDADLDIRGDATVASAWASVAP